MNRDMHNHATSEVPSVDICARTSQAKVLTTQNHQRDQVTRHPAHPQLDRSIPPQRHHRDTKRGEHDTHGDVRDRLRVGRAAREVERAVVACQQAGEADEHLPERWVHVEVELALEVVRAELAKVCLVPDDDVRLADLVEPGPA